MEFFSVGKIIKPHGLKGEVYIRLSTPERSWAPELKQVKLTRAGQEVYWNTEKARPHKEGILLLPKELSSIEEAEEFRGYELHIPKSFFISEPGEHLFLSEVMGFQIVDEENQERGEIIGFEQLSDQDLAKVKSPKGNTYLLPFLDANILQKDWENKRITMRIPEGIESLNQ